jgi:predicted SnoaL-like aldol condensation-catalyzing enzyme
MGGKRHKEIVTDFFRFIAEGRPKEGLKFCSTDCVQHNPYTQGGMNELFDGMLDAMKNMPNEFPDPELKVRQVLDDGDFAAAYTQLLSRRDDPSKGGLRQVHLFRFKGDKIVEYWDVTQVISPDMPNPGAAF